MAAPLRAADEPVFQWRSMRRRTTHQGHAGQQKALDALGVLRRDDRRHPSAKTMSHEDERRGADISESRGNELRVEFGPAGAVGQWGRPKAGQIKGDRSDSLSRKEFAREGEITAGATPAM